MVEKKMSAVAALVLAAMAMGTGVAAAQEPKLVNAVAPEYPRAAERRNIEGEVQLKIVVDANGKVAGVEVVEATPPGVFDSAAIAAVEKWEFEKGVPSEGLTKKLAFKLQ